MSEESAQGLLVVQQGCGPWKGRTGAVDREGRTGEVGDFAAQGREGAGASGGTLSGFSVTL